ncbi:MAG: TolC family protein [Niabella sp.]
MAKIKLTTFLLLLLSASRLAAQETHYFSLQQTIEYAEKNNVQVKNALLDIQMQEQVNREVTGRAYPQISGTGGIAYNPNVMTQKMPNFFSPAVVAILQQFGVKDGNGNEIVFDPNGDFGYIEAQFGTKWNSSAGVSLNQILFDGQVFTGLQARKTLIQTQEKAHEVTAEQVRVNITKIYYQLIVAKTQLSLLDTTISFIEKNRHDTKIMYDNGFAEKLDIDKLDVQLTNVNSLRSQTVTQINNGYLGLKVLIGMPVSEGLILTDSLSDEDIKKGLLEATEFNYDQRRDYQLAKLGIKLKEFDMQRYKLSKIPSLALSGSYSKIAMDNTMGSMFRSKWFTSSAIQLGINVPIFTGFATNAKISQAQISLRQSQNQLEALANAIDNERKSAINTFKSAITDMDYQKQNMALAEKVYHQTKKKYEVGTGSQMEIDNARVQLQTAQTNYYTALYNAVVARVDFLKSIGKL